MTYAQDYEVLGVLKTHELVPDGTNKIVTNDNKLEYIESVYTVYIGCYP